MESEIYEKNPILALYLPYIYPKRSEFFTDSESVHIMTKGHQRSNKGQIVKLGSNRTD